MTLTRGQNPVKPLPAAGVQLFRDYRVLRHHDAQIITGSLHPWVDRSDPELKRLQDGWPGKVYLAPAGEGDGHLELTLVREVRAARYRWILSGALFLATLLTTLMAGALLQGLEPVRFNATELGGIAVPLPVGLRPDVLMAGAPFALGFMAILLAHEMGHFVAARRHGIRASLPYFIPVPAHFTVVGTLGAFIQIRSPIVRPRTLLDVGAAGPVASFLLSLPVVALGLALSRPLESARDPLTPYAVEFGGQVIWLGDGLLFRVLALGITGAPVGAEGLVLHPLAFAGWLGLFVTFLNLIPLGQLDGGHVAHALLGRRQRWVGALFLAAMVPMGFVWWGWWFWGLVALALGRGKLSSPGVVQDQVGLDRPRRSVAWGLAAVFLVILPPVPLGV